MNNWAGPTDKVWNDMQCKSISTWYIESLEACKGKCYELPRCNAIIGGRSGSCNLRDCPAPIPEPILYKNVYSGYYRLSGRIRETLN